MVSDTIFPALAWERRKEYLSNRIREAIGMIPDGVKPDGPGFPNVLFHRVDPWNLNGINTITLSEDSWYPSPWHR